MGGSACRFKSGSLSGPQRAGAKVPARAATHVRVPPHACHAGSGRVRTSEAPGSMLGSGDASQSSVAAEESGGTGSWWRPGVQPGLNFRGLPDLLIMLNII